ncbi:hypothetical protein [Anthocerotibacter panamensis]|uniref:hypothetical protein n=1 Tax=Anthocerotibacter panamensis TaxID=2857077 RepID=UPI001C407BB9|nr:hypothetical protein [Anthocerotibacter panamensis]
MTEQEHRLNQQILQLLTPEVVRQIYGRINYFGHLRGHLEADELSQYIRIAAWKALVRQPNLLQSTPRKVTTQIYDRLVPLVLNTGKEKLGAGVRRKGNQFHRAMLPLFE